MTGYQGLLDAWQRAIAGALPQGEDRFRTEWEATSEAMALSDSDGMVLAVNPAYCALYGLTSEQAVRHSFAIIFPEDAREAAVQQYHAVFCDPDPLRSYEAQVQRPDGSQRLVEARVEFLVRDGERVAMLSVIRDITESRLRKRADRDFVAMASHDLASPLRALRARAKLLLHQQRYDKASVLAILTQAERMQRVLVELRELVELEGGALFLQREHVDLATLAADAVGRIGLLPTAHTLRLDVPERPVVVLGDRDRLGQVLAHLLDNAIRYSPDGGEIRVRVAAEGGDALLRVVDQGVGIPAAVLPHLFERMYRGHSTMEEAGSGLGLYLSRMLVEAHGGRIAATSEFGGGSTFTVTIPLELRP